MHTYTEVQLAQNITAERPKRGIALTHACTVLSCYRSPAYALMVGAAPPPPQQQSSYPYDPAAQPSQPPANDPTGGLGPSGPSALSLTYPGPGGGASSSFYHSSASLSYGTQGAPASHADMVNSARLGPSTNRFQATQPTDLAELERELQRERDALGPGLAARGSMSMGAFGGWLGADRNTSPGRGGAAPGTGGGVPGGPAGLLSFEEFVGTPFGAMGLVDSAAVAAAATPAAYVGMTPSQMAAQAAAAAHVHTLQRRTLTLRLPHGWSQVRGREGGVSVPACLEHATWGAKLHAGPM